MITECVVDCVVIAQEGGFYPGGIFWPAVLLLVWQLLQVLAPVGGAYVATRGVKNTARRLAWIFLSTVAGCLLSFVFCGVLLYLSELIQSRSRLGMGVAFMTGPLVGWLLGHAVATLLRRGSGP